MSVPYELTFSDARSSTGCWTCRLRRKKCDQRRPVCESCRSLEITCHFGREKPEWMNSGPKKREMANRIKAQVKQKASQRRDRIFTKLLDSHAQEAVHRTVADNANAPIGDSTTSDTTLGRHICQIDSRFNADSHFVMVYLDYVFPYLFPHYRPPVHSGGRGWVLDVLQSNEPVYHTVIALSAYFFGAVIAYGVPKHQSCVSIIGDKMQKQLQLGLKELQSDMGRINSRGQAVSFDEKLLVMQAIIQMVIIEVATKSSNTWKVHLDAAIALFLQIISVHTGWAETLEFLDNSHNSSSMNFNPRSLPPYLANSRPWTTSQAALRFFTANLITMDIVSSIALEQQPRLRSHYDQIIPHFSSEEEHARVPPSSTIFMDDFVGLHNWTVQIMSDVATLHAWKREQVTSGEFQRYELLSRGQILIDALESTLDRLGTRLQSQETHVWMPWMAEDPLPRLQYGTRGRGIASLPPQLAFHNQIWLYAILLYLRTVMFGWQPTQVDMRNTHKALTQSLSDLPEGALIRSMVLPFCIGGCLAAQEEEDSYRQMVQHMGPLHAFGTVKSALEIMETVWSSRHEIDESWDLARCLRILGCPVLLV